MAYSVYADMQEEILDEILIDLTNEGGASPDLAKIASSIEWADAIIDGYIGQIVSVPLAAPVPNRVREASVDIAIYGLFTRLGKPPESREKRYQDSMEWLQAVAAGDASIGAPTDGSTSSREPIYEAPDTDFTDAVWEMY